MAAVEEPLISTNQKVFVIRSLLDGLRTDGRFFNEARKTRIALRRYEDATNAEVEMGKTRVHAVATATLGQPFGDRGNEGTLSFVVNIGPLAGSQYETSKGASSSNAPITAELARMLERQIRDSRALDLEALCVTPGQRVWQLRVDVHVLSDDGNLSDAASLAAISALAHFRRPEVTVLRGGKGVKIHSFAEAVPQPLSLHHIPVAVTLGLFNDPETRLKTLDFTAASVAASSSAGAGGDADVDEQEGKKPSSSSTGGLAGTSDYAVVDPTALEEAVYDGRVTLVMNAHRELCGIHKLGGAPVYPQALSAAVKIAGQRAQELVAMVKQAVAAAEKESEARDAEKVVAATVGLAPKGTLKVDAGGSTSAGASSSAPR